LRIAAVAGSVDRAFVGEMRRVLRDGQPGAGLSFSNWDKAVRAHVGGDIAEANRNSGAGEAARAATAGRIAGIRGGGATPELQEGGGGALRHADGDQDDAW
jgi:hypothetical protein